MEAELFSYSVDANFRCPNCRLFFRLVNGQIPTKKEEVIRCEGCDELIIINPVKISLIQKSSNKKEEPEEQQRSPFGPIYVQAKKVIMKYGWSAVEADDLLIAAIENNEFPDDVEVSVLVKLALSSVSDKQDNTVKSTKPRFR